jgi:8-oxo-dGTP diphosphatase
MMTNTHKPHLFVSAGILFNAKEAFLLASRPSGKAYAGYWEFPGGKIESGETALMALKRELAEEMGITVLQAYPWLQQDFDYPHAQVTLFFFQVTAWEGEIIAQEQQQFSWQSITNLTVHPILPANAPILRALALPRALAISDAKALGETGFLNKLVHYLDQGLTWLILHEPHLDAAQFTAFAKKVLALTCNYPIKIVFYDHLACAQALGADGILLSTAALMACKSRPSALPYCGAFIDTKAALNQAAALKLDYAILKHLANTPAHFSQPRIHWPGVGDMLQHHNKLPVYAMGGLAQQDIPQAREQGAHGIAFVL